MSVRTAAPTRLKVASLAQSRERCMETEVNRSLQPECRYRTLDNSQCIEEGESARHRGCIKQLTDHHSCSLIARVGDENRLRPEVVHGRRLVHVVWPVRAPVGVYELIEKLSPTPTRLGDPKHPEIPIWLCRAPGVGRRKIRSQFVVNSLTGYQLAPFYVQH